MDARFDVLLRRIECVGRVIQEQFGGRRYSGNAMYASLFGKDNGGAGHRDAGSWFGVVSAATVNGWRNRCIATSPQSDARGAGFSSSAVDGATNRAMQPQAAAGVRLRKCGAPTTGCWSRPNPLGTLAEWASGVRGDVVIMVMRCLPRTARRKEGTGRRPRDIARTNLNK
jgi:hypothetical protein